MCGEQPGHCWGIGGGGERHPNLCERILRCHAVFLVVHTGGKVDGVQPAQYCKVHIFLFLHAATEMWTTVVLHRGQVSKARGSDPGDLVSRCYLQRCLERCQLPLSVSDESHTLHPCPWRRLADSVSNVYRIHHQRRTAIIQGHLAPGVIGRDNGSKNPKAAPRNSGCAMASAVGAPFLVFPTLATQEVLQKYQPVGLFLHSRHKCGRRHCAPVGAFSLPAVQGQLPTQRSRPSPRCR